MNTTRRFSAFLFGLLFSLAATLAHAAVNVTPTDATGVPGGLATSTLTFDIGVNYPFGAFDLTVEYDSALLTFMPGNSSVMVGATPYSFNDFISALVAVNTAINAGTDIYAISTFVNVSVPVSGPVVFSTAFKLADDFTGPAMVNYSGALSGGEEDLFSGAMTISAVPEPQVWLMWLAGLGLLAVKYGRRRS